MKNMDVIVIGGGISGLASAYQLQAAGHRVSVIERHPSVAQGATYGNGGALLPSPLDVWFGPTFMMHRRDERNGIVYKPGMDRALRRFVKRLSALHAPDAFAAQYGKLHALIELSRRALAEIEERFAFEFEQKSGVLHVVRETREWTRLRPALDLLREHRIPHEVLTAEGCAAHEPSVPFEPPFAGGVLLAAERTANCPLFAKLLKQQLEELGVAFRFGRATEAIRADAAQVRIELAPAEDAKRTRTPETITADAVVVAAGTGTVPLLRKLGAKLPLHAMRYHTLNAPIAYEEHAPHLCVVDSVQRISMTRTPQRLRIGGAAVLQSAADLAKPLAEPLADAALALLGQATHDWLPGAAKISAARPWEGQKLLSPDGLPVVGPVSTAAAAGRVFVNAGHGPAGWGLACGSATVIADYLAGLAPHVPAETLAAMSVARFAA